MNSIELLEHSTSIARQLAPLVCRGCVDLHGIWPELRALGLAADPHRHDTFFASSLGSRARQSPNVLISGCADWGMLDTVASAYRTQAAQLAATVVDRCATPVMLCAWYGAQRRLPIRTAVAELREYEDEMPFDLICTHSILTYLPLDGRRELVANWHRLLRKGGSVITVTRLDSASAPSPPRDVAAAREFGELAVERRLERGLGGDPDELRARAERFAMAQTNHQVGTEADVRSLFEGGGFEVAELVARSLPGATAARAAAGAARPNQYAEIVAVKP